MAKPTLGRGLGELLGSNRAGAEPSAPVKPPGVGLRILIDGGAQPESESITQPATAPAPPLEARALNVAAIPPKEKAGEAGTRLMAAVALIGADVALLGWAAHHVMNHAHSLGLRGAAVCVGSIFLAAWCGCVVVRLLSRRS